MPPLSVRSSIRFVTHGEIPLPVYFGEEAAYPGFGIVFCLVSSRPPGGFYPHDLPSGLTCNLFRRETASKELGALFDS